MQETEIKKRAPGGGRKPVVRSSLQQARYAHWSAWWAIRPGGRPSARELAGRMEEVARTVQAYAKGTRWPSAAALANLESLSAAYGYRPLTSDHQFL